MYGCGGVLTNVGFYMEHTNVDIYYKLLFQNRITLATVAYLALMYVLLHSLRLRAYAYGLNSISNAAYILQRNKWAVLRNCLSGFS